MLIFYKNLPDYMTVEELEHIFGNFLKQVMLSEYILVEALESLLELSDRQWHTYDLLDENIKMEIENWLIKVMDFQSEEVIEYMTLIMARLGLAKLHSIFCASLENNLKKEIRQIIEQAIKEINQHINNPYFGMM